MSPAVQASQARGRLPRDHGAQAHGHPQARAVEALALARRVQAAKPAPIRAAGFDRATNATATRAPVVAVKVRRIAPRRSRRGPAGVVGANLRGRVPPGAPLPI